MASLFRSTGNSSWSRDWFTAVVIANGLWRGYWVLALHGFVYLRVRGRNRKPKKWRCSCKQMDWNLGVVAGWAILEDRVSS
jgi:hypothetical protein